MTQKKKAIIALSSLIFTFVVAVVSVVSIFAVSNATFKTDVTISYTTNIAGGTYSFAYKNSTDAEYIYLQTDVPFVTSEDDTPAQNSPGITNTEVELSQENPYFILRWDFVNTAYSHFNCTLNYVDTGDADYGVKMGTNYYVDKSITNMADGSLSSGSASTGNKAIFSAKAVYGTNTANLVTTYIGQKYGTFYVKVTLSDKYTNGLFDGDFTWTIESYRIT